MRDYNKYRIDELQDVYNMIDREDYPVEFQLIVSELERRKKKPC